MSPTERERQVLFARAAAVLGEKAAEVMMSYLPSHPVPELLTVSRFESEMIGLRGEIAELRAELKGDMAELRAELKGDMAELRAELKGDMAGMQSSIGMDIARLYRWGAAVVAANAVTVITVLLT